MDMEVRWTHFVVMTSPTDMHEIQFVHQTRLLERVESPVNGCAVNRRVLFLCQSKYSFHVEMVLGGVQHMGDYSALLRQAHTLGPNPLHEAVVVRPVRFFFLATHSQ